MLEFHSGSSGLVNTRRAVAECLEVALGTGSTDCNLVVFCTTMGHNFPELLSEVHRLAPSAKIVGTTSSGVIGRSGPNESMRALALMAVRGPADCLSVAGEESLVQHDYYQAGAAIARQLQKSTPEISFILMYVSPLGYPNGPVDNVVRGMESVVGPDVPIIGGFSTDNNKIVTCYEFLEDRILERGAVAVAFTDPGLEVISRSNHGFTVLGEPFVATKVDGSHVYELNGKPAWTLLCERLGVPEETHPMSIFPFAALAEELPPELHEEYGANYLARFAAALTDGRGGIYCFHTVEPGARLWLLERDEQEIFNGISYLTGEMIRKLDGRRPIAVFHSDCLLRGKLLFNRIAKEEIVTRIQEPICGTDEIPWLGMYGAGEVGPLGGRNMVHLFTTTVAAVTERSE